MLKEEEKRKGVEEEQKREIEEYMIRISKLRELPIKKHILLKSQLQQAIVCMKELITKM